MFAKLARTLSFVVSHGWNFFRPRKKLGLVSLVLIASAVISIWLIFTPPAQAFGVDDIFSWFATILLAIAGFFIKLTFFVLKFIIEVAGYNGFIDSPAVTVGWVMVRDMTNMFFVVVLLAIAFGTILGLKNYEYTHLLGKLLIAAIVVNFSRLICGLIIDIAQVVMVTFINGIAATASGNLVNMFQVDKIFALGAGTGSLGSGSAAFLAGIAAVFFASIMLFTMVAFLFMIMARMAMLWILIVLSPLAFVLNVLPQTESKAHEWWSQFMGNVITGPIIAFFLWLSFVTVGSGSIHDEIKQHNSLPPEHQIQGTSSEEESIGITQVMTWDKMANFIIAIAMLMAGAKVAGEYGAAGGSMIGAAQSMGKKFAMYASGLRAAKWVGVNGGKALGKGLYYGSNMVPGLAGIHPEAWKRRAGNIKSRAKAWYYDSKVASTVKAGEISKAFRVNRAGKFVKDVKVARTDEQGKVVTDEHGNIVYDKKEVEQKGIGDWLKRFGAKARLEMGSGYDAFHHAYSEDLEATAEAKFEQLDHLASTSSLPIGLEKQKSKEWLEFLEHTGGDIKAGKKANMDQLREEVMEILHHGEEHGASDEAVNEELRELGLSELEIYKAKQGFSRFGKSVKSKAEADVTTEYVSAEHKIKQQEALKEMLEKQKGAELGMKASDAKAAAEQITLDIQQARDLQLARARDNQLKELNRYSEANNEQTTINEQVDQRIKKHSAAGDYVQAEAKTISQLERIEQQRKELEQAIQNKDQKAIEKVSEVLKVLERSLSEMQISNLGTHAAVADGVKGRILDAVGMPKVQSMGLTPEAIRQLQAQDLAELINEKVDPTSHATLQKALEKLEELYGEKANAMLEQKRLKNEKAAGQGSLGRAGLYAVDPKTLQTILTNADTPDGINHVAGRRQSGLSGSKLTNVIGFAGSMDKIIVTTDEGEQVVRAAAASEASKDIFLKLAAGLTGNNLGSVDEYTKADVGEIFENSSEKDLQDILNRLKERMTDKKALEGLLNFALEKNRMKTKEKIDVVMKALEEIRRNGKPGSKKP